MGERLTGPNGPDPPAFRSESKASLFTLEKVKFQVTPVNECVSFRLFSSALQPWLFR